MALFKCKMCGGTIEFEQGATVGVCDSCGTKQTLPRLDDDKKANLYDRANHFRRNNEFDKAMAIYEQLLNEDNTDAEAYWSLVLCRYGIEYVEDPATHKRVPTVNRAQFTSVYMDEDYKSALQHADGYQKQLYEEEAKAIDEIQKGILEISSKEEPFDVFICYKETDNGGKRTADSVLANDLYHQLTQEGFKVFFARITLEDKLGSAYEPYIFAALNSAKVMVVLGTKPEYFNAVWVKNEWSRYLALVKQSGGKKMLIPAYKDMDPYDLPEEFSHLQAQDMAKLGFMQDLIRGIKKIVQHDTPQTIMKETVTVNGSTNIAPLLKRVLIFLEDGDWKSADEYCEKVLDIDPENAQAYLGKLMAELHVKKQEDLQNASSPFNDNSNFQKALRYGDDALKEELNNYGLERVYREAKRAMSARKYIKAMSLFESICDYQDSAALAQECCEKDDIARKDAIMADGKKAMNRGDYKKAIQLFESIRDYLDSAALAEECKEQDRIAKLDATYQKAKAHAARREYEKAIRLFESIGSYLDSEALIRECYEKAEGDRKDAILREAKERMDEDCIQQYEKAIELLETIPGWKESDEQCALCKKRIAEITAQTQRAERIVKIKKLSKILAIVLGVAAIALIIAWNIVIAPNQKLNKALKLLNSGDYETAYALIRELGNNSATASKKYNKATEFLNSGDYKTAYILLTDIDYEDSAERAKEIYNQHRDEMIKASVVGDTIYFGTYEQDNDPFDGTEEIEWRVLDKEENRLLVISDKALHCKPYHTDTADVTWETCSLRAWLNDTFLNSAFSAEEQAKILTTTVPATLYNDYYGNVTEDKLFQLDTFETNRYFESSKAKKCVSTPYAVHHGAEEEYACYWMRNPYGMDRRYTQIVTIYGEIKHSVFVDSDYVCIRPAMWIDLAS